MINLILFSVFFFALVSVIYFAYQQWDRHKQRSLAAKANGWRYSPRGWRRCVSPHYYLVGSTKSGIIWEMRRVEEGSQLQWCWQTASATLEHGFLQIWPRSLFEQESLPQDLIKHQAINIGSKKWQDEFVLLTTHQFLMKSYLTPELEDAMLATSDKALVKVRWERDLLQINGRYYDDWSLIERIVEMGTLLTTRHKNVLLAQKEPT